jgi:metal-responsive CopG/Arc/MetJ family transcriptional regulator
MIIDMKAIQFTLDEALLRRVDADPEVKEKGRSAFLRNAIDEYLKRRRERSIRDAYRRGYRSRPVRAGEFEMSDRALAWPDE